jgi:hypothetical protein
LPAWRAQVARRPHGRNPLRNPCKALRCLRVIRDPPPSNLRLAPDSRNPRQYEQNQADLLECSSPERPLADRLIALSLYCVLLEEYVRHAHKEGCAGAEDEADGRQRESFFFAVFQRRVYPARARWESAGLANNV